MAFGSGAYLGPHGPLNTSRDSRSRGSSHNWERRAWLPSSGMNGLTAGAQNSKDAKNVADTAATRSTLVRSRVTAVPLQKLVLEGSSLAPTSALPAPRIIAVSESVPELVPESVSELVPESVSESVPELVPESVPELVPESVPEFRKDAPMKMLSLATMMALGMAILSAQGQQAADSGYTASVRSRWNAIKRNISGSA